MKHKKDKWSKCDHGLVQGMAVTVPYFNNDTNTVCVDGWFPIQVYKLPR